MARRENWGEFVTPEGEKRTMIRGPRNQTWFEDERGERVGPVQSNVVPALGWMYAETEWRDETDPEWLTEACRRQARNG